MKSADSYGSKNGLNGSRDCGLPVSPSRSGSGATDSVLGVCCRDLLIGVHPIVYVAFAVQHCARCRFQKLRAFAGVPQLCKGLFTDIAVC